MTQPPDPAPETETETPTHAELDARIHRLEAGHRELEEALDYFSDHADDASLHPAAGKRPDSDTQTRKANQQDKQPAPVFPNVYAWVEGWFIGTLERRIGGQTRWCARWWAHAEAVFRFQLLWRSWEVLRLDAGTGMGVWAREYLEIQLPVLLGPDGPFAQCSKTSHEPLPPLVVEPIPRDLAQATGSAPARTISDTP